MTTAHLCANLLRCSSSYATKTDRLNVRYAICLMITSVLLTLPDWSLAAPPPSAKPEWSAGSTISTDNGYGVLEWSLPQGLPADLFELQERFDGQQRTSFVTGRSLNLYRPDAGTYEFRIASCIKDDQGYPSCGPQSSKFEFTVTEAIYDPLIESGVTAPPPEPVATTTVQGGPDQLRPGLWYNPSKDGIGWSFYW